ncbi:MAG: hypothetical protein PHQ23_09010 [Candidatus Wallbacteria bacterium]|nr:hypothetical protein [Candidatus Wallbacteria bacterium]
MRINNNLTKKEAYFGYKGPVFSAGAIGGVAETWMVGAAEERTQPGQDVPASGPRRRNRTAGLNKKVCRLDRIKDD